MKNKKIFWKIKNIFYGKIKKYFEKNKKIF
jgi:hypothetical protein